MRVALSWLDDGTPDRRRVSYALATTVALALAVRLAHLDAVSATPFLELSQYTTGTDMHFYWEWAGRLGIEGDWWQRDTYHPGDRPHTAEMQQWYVRWGGREIFNWEPVYPYLLGLLRMWGAGLPQVVVLQLALGALVPLVIYRLARCVAGFGPSFLSACLAAVYGPLVHIQSVTLRDGLQPLTEPWIIIALFWAAGAAVDRWWRWVVAGAALGAGLLVKSTVMMFVPVAIVWILWRSRGDWVAAARRSAWWLAGVMIAFSPLIVRNVVVGAPPLAITNRVGMSLALANARDADPVGYYEPPSMIPILDKAEADTAVIVRETLATWEGDYLGLAALQWRKLRAWIDPFEVADNASYRWSAELSPVLEVLPGWGVLLPLALLGLAVAVPRAWRDHALLVGFVVSVFGGLMLTMVVGRFRVPLMPVLAVYAGAAGWWLIECVRAKRWVSVTGGVAGLGVVLVLQQFVLPLADTRESMVQMVGTQQHFAFAEAYVRSGRWDEAVGEMRRMDHKIRDSGRSFAGDDLARKMEVAVWIRWSDAARHAGHRDHAIELMGQAYEAAHAAPIPGYDLEFADHFASLEAWDLCRAALRNYLHRQPDGPDAARARTMLERLGGPPVLQ